MTHLAPNRDLAMSVGYRATDWSGPLDFSDYLNALNDWTVEAIMRGDECIGAVYRKGEEIHVSIVPEWRRKWVTKGLLKQLFAGQRVTTRVTPGHEYMYGILERIGFRKTDDGALVLEKHHGH